MMLVPNYLDRSPIHGIGIFSRDLIRKGERVWEFTPGFDQVFDDRQLSTLLPLQRAAVLFYCYVENGRSGAVLCCDNARHFNYAADPNCGPQTHEVGGYLSAFALRDIRPGEELTYSIDEDDDSDRKLAAGD